MQGVGEDDIIALKAAILDDEHSAELKEKRFGPAVKLWLQQMWGKAMDNLWNVELGVVSGLLTTALQRYYGWS